LDYLKLKCKIKKEVAIEGNIIRSPIEVKPELNCVKEKQ